MVQQRQLLVDVGTTESVSSDVVDRTAMVSIIYPNNTLSLRILPCPPVPEAELVLETPRFALQIRIRGTKCRLLGPELPELRHLLDTNGMGAGPLIMELERAGICLTPSDEDAKRATRPSATATATLQGGERVVGTKRRDEEEDRLDEGIVLKER